MGMVRTCVERNSLAVVDFPEVLTLVECPLGRCSVGDVGVGWVTHCLERQLYLASMRMYRDSSNNVYLNESILI